MGEFLDDSQDRLTAVQHPDGLEPEQRACVNMPYLAHRSLNIKVRAYVDQHDPQVYHSRLSRSLVVATSLGIYWCMSYEEFFAEMMPPPPPPGEVDLPPDIGGVEPLLPLPMLTSRAYRVARYCRFLSFFLCAYTLWFIFARFRQPRPCVRELGNSWGTSACVTTAVLIAAKAQVFLTTWLSGLVFVGEVEFDWQQIVRDLGGQAGPAILATWLILLMCGRPGSIRNWLEAFGVLLAIGWEIVFFEPTIYNFAVWCSEPGPGEEPWRPRTIEAVGVLAEDQSRDKLPDRLENPVPVQIKDQLWSVIRPMMRSLPGQ